MYCNYCYHLSDSELLIDNSRTAANREVISKTMNQLSLTSKDCLLAFAMGQAFGMLLCVSPAWADNIEPVKQGKKAISRRLSDMVGCASIPLICSKANPTKTVKLVVQDATNGEVAVAFACGVFIAWCFKRVFFGKG